MIRFLVMIAMLLLTGCMNHQQPGPPIAEAPTAREARLQQLGRNFSQMCANSGYPHGTAENFQCTARLAAIYLNGPAGMR